MTTSLSTMRIPLWLRPIRWLGVCVMALATNGCGEQKDDPSPASPEASAPDAPTGDACRPRNLGPWVHAWKPPKAPAPSACTDMQIQRQYALCEDDVTYDALACKAFQRDPANSACRACLFSTEDESTYGAIVIMRDRSEMANVAGCIGWLEGDLTAGGCGAKYQAVNACFDAACRDDCTGNAEYLQCRKWARDGVCSMYADDMSCANRASYSTCATATTFQEYFFLMARFFCSSGTTDGGSRDAGAETSPVHRVPESPNWAGHETWATPEGLCHVKSTLSEP
jgi:hypothetical protein